MNKKILNSILFVMLVATISSLPFLVFADDNATGNTTQLGTMAAKVETTAIGVATSVVLIGWIIAGILYLTAAGAPDKLGVAKKALVACVIGTVLVALAMGSTLIISIIKETFGINNTTFLYHASTVALTYIKNFL